MKAVPANATMAGAGTLRIPAILPMITEAVRAVSPENATEMTQTLDAFEQKIEVPIRENLLGNFAGTYTYYIVPVENPMFTQGLVVLLDVKDSTTVETALTKVEQWAKSQIPPNTISEKTKTFDDQHATLHAWNLIGLNLPMQATWAVCKDTLVIEFSAGSSGGAVDQLMAGGPSLGDQPAYLAVVETFPPHASHYSFSDDKARTSDVMKQLAMVWTVLQMAANQTGEMTLPFLPPASDVSKHLGTTGSYTFTDEIGMHTRTVGSFPGSDPVFVTGGVTGLTSILLPSLSRAGSGGHGDARGREGFLEVRACGADGVAAPAQFAQVLENHHVLIVVAASIDDVAQAGLAGRAADVDDEREGACAIKLKVATRRDSCGVGAFLGVRCVACSCGVRFGKPVWQQQLVGHFGPPVVLQDFELLRLDQRRWIHWPRLGLPVQNEQKSDSHPGNRAESGLPEDPSLSLLHGYGSCAEVIPRRCPGWASAPVARESSVSDGAESTVPYGSPAFRFDAATAPALHD
jgi:hypothetical protein